MFGMHVAQNILCFVSLQLLFFSRTVCAGTVQSPRMPVSHAVCEKEGAVIGTLGTLLVPPRNLAGCTTWRQGMLDLLALAIPLCSNALLHAGPSQGLSTNAVRS